MPRPCSRLAAPFLPPLVAAVLLVCAGPALAEHVPPLDRCVGVDHPPFVQAYDGDGLSYLLFGATVPLDAFPPGTTVHGVLDGNGRSVEASDPVDDSGRALLTFPLTSYGGYELTIDVGGHPLLTEQVSVGPQEPPCSRDQLAQAPAPEPTQEATTPRSTPAEEPTTEPETAQTTPPAEPESTGETGGGVPWGLLLGGGAVVGLGGLLLARGGRACDEEKRAWDAAERRREQAEADAARAREAAERASAERAKLDAELAEIRKVFPNAGKPGGEDSWVESEGRRVTGRDVRMRRDADRAAWERYRANPSPESAKEAMEAWGQADTPEAAAHRREVDDRAKDLQRRRDEAADAERDAKRAAEHAEAEARKAAEAAQAAKAAYDACVGRASAHDGEQGGDAGGHGEAPGGGVAVGTEAGEGTRTRLCPEGQEKEENVVTLGTVKLPVRLNARVEGGGAHEAAEAGRDIAGTLKDVSERLGWVSLAMDIKGIGSKLVFDRDGWKALGESVAPMAGAATGTPVPTSPAQAAVDYLRTVADIASVIIGKVPEWQERRLPDCDVTISSHYRWLRLTCSELYRCVQGEWVSQGKRFTVVVEREGSGGQRRQTALTWAQAQAEIARADDRFTAELSRALEQLERSRAQCGAGS